MKHESFNESTEMYLKTVRELAIANQGPVPISALAEQMGVSNVSATEMVHRLRNQGLLDHVPYKGVTLTPEGQRRTTELVRSHHMWEWFLFDTLGLSWAQSHDLACRLEHATDSIVTEALAAFLGHPQHCPHGNPVPDPAGHTPPAEDRPLTTLRPGQQAVICRIHPESTLLLEYLETHGLQPGITITIDDIAPFSGPIMVASQHKIHPLGQEVARHIFVTQVSSVPEQKHAGAVHEIA